MTLFWRSWGSRCPRNSDNKYVCHAADALEVLVATFGPHVPRSRAARQLLGHVCRLKHHLWVVEVIHRPHGNLQRHAQEGPAAYSYGLVMFGWDHGQLQISLSYLRYFETKSEQDPKRSAWPCCHVAVLLLRLSRRLGMREWVRRCSGHAHT